VMDVSFNMVPSGTDHRRKFPARKFLSISEQSTDSLSHFEDSATRLYHRT
jgi:hypothetical protein